MKTPGSVTELLGRLRIVCGDPSPDEVAALAEEAEKRLKQLADDLRRIAFRKLEGYTNAEIAALPEMRWRVPHLH